MKKIYIIKAGDTFPDIAETLGDFDVWTAEGLGHVTAGIEILDVKSEFTLPEPEECAGVVITGSHAMVTDNLPWSVRIEAWIPRLIETGKPVLGICYGHQLLARAAGGRVDYHAGGKEIGTVSIQLSDKSSEDPLFRSIPQSFPAHVTHSQTVVQLPPTAVRLAANEFEPNHAFRIGRAAWGVQFHPEYNGDIMRAYIMAQETELESAGLDVQQILQTIKETPFAAEILRNFGSLMEK